MATSAPEGSSTPYVVRQTTWVLETDDGGVVCNVPPKAHRTLDADVAEKPVPVSVTVWPPAASPSAGSIAVTVGGAKTLSVRASAVVELSSSRAGIVLPPTLQTSELLAAVPYSEKWAPCSVSVVPVLCGTYCGVSDVSVTSDRLYASKLRVPYALGSASTSLRDTCTSYRPGTTPDGVEHVSCVALTTVAAVFSCAVELMKRHVLLPEPITAGNPAPETMSVTGVVDGAPHTLSSLTCELYVTKVTLSSTKHRLMGAIDIACTSTPLRTFGSAGVGQTACVLLITDPRSCAVVRLPIIARHQTSMPESGNVPTSVTLFARLYAPPTGKVVLRLNADGA
eukprot:7383291-Prymnesium_polylepis.2